jgi:hypothetical protein
MPKPQNNPKDLVGAHAIPQEIPQASGEGITTTHNSFVHLEYRETQQS